MQQIKPSDRLASLLDRFAKDGIVVEYFVFALDNGTGSLEVAHRKTAASGLALIQGHYLEVAEKRRQRFNTWRGLGSSDESFYSERTCFRVTFDITKATATEESRDEFLKDYWYAFSDPPYGTSIAEPNLTKLFDEVNRVLFDDLSQWSIRRWSTDWSNYFDAGLEWWGAFLWTLVSPDRLRAVWIGASTTD
jgi:hypothetical protein